MVVENLPAEPFISKGKFFAIYSFDIGNTIDLNAIEKSQTLSQRAKLLTSKRVPRHMEIQPLPLRISQRVASVEVGEFKTEEIIDLTLYDFGAASLTFQFEISGPFRNIIRLCDALYDNTKLNQLSQEIMTNLMETLKPHIAKAHLMPAFESYNLIQIADYSPNRSPSELLKIYQPLFGQLLRSDQVLLSEEEINEATSGKLSYSREDLTVIDWSTGIVFDQKVEDIMAVLDFANVSLVELRFLDSQLDNALTDFYAGLTKTPKRRWTLLPRSDQKIMSKLSRLQVDSAMLFEDVNHSFKLFGDYYLSRVYRVAANRFKLENWNQSILRKLETLESIYQKTNHRTANQRMELLEWIIIILISVSILLPYLPGGSH